MLILASLKLFFDEGNEHLDTKKDSGIFFFKYLMCVWLLKKDSSWWSYSA